MRRIGKGFLGVETHLFDAMLVPQQVQDDATVQEDEDDNEVSVAPTPPSPKPTTPPPPPQQEPIPSPPQAQSAQPSSPPPQQPSQTTDILMSLLNTLLETCATLTQKEVGEEEEIQVFRVKEIEEGGGGIVELDVDKDVTLKDFDAEVEIDANIQGRIVESQAKVYNLDLHHSEKVLSMQDTDEAEPVEVKEVLEVVTAAKLMTEVVTTVAPITIVAQVPKPSAPKKRRCVVIQDHEEIIALVIIHIEVKPKDKGKGILIEEPKPLKGKAQIDMDEAFAR
nr:hypothetical protein [Tanacetum cinerariifolium]